MPDPSSLRTRGQAAGLATARSTPLRAIAACLAIALALPASASEPLVDGYFAAVKRFEARVAESGQRDAMPSVKDSDALKLLGELADTRVLTDRSYKVGELGLLLGICAKATSASASYALFNLRKQVSPGDSQQAVAAKVRELAEENALRFQTEIAMLQPFILRCAAVQAPLLDEFVRSLPADQLTDTRRKGVQQVQTGAVSIYQGVLLSHGDARIERDNRLRMVKALAETSSSIVQILPLDTRRQLLEMAKSALASAEEPFQAPLKQVADSLTDIRCQSLCRL